MRVIFAIPALTNTVHLQCMKSLMMVQRMLDLKGVEHEMFTVCSCPVITVARNSLVAMFMEDAAATDLFFIDSDVGFDPEAVLKILDRPEEIVAGIYPLKRDAGGYPVQILTEDGVPIGRDGLVEAKLLPTGFMRIKRTVFEKIRRECPEALDYDDDYVLIEGSNLKGGYNYFGMGIYEKTLRTEDFAFSQRWRDLGGRLWVYPDVNFEHVGQKAYSGNYHEHLMRLPGGAKSDIAKACAIEGWMTVAELDWLAQQAKTHGRILEIGCWMGRSTRALADNTVGTVTAVDTWLGSVEHSNVPVDLYRRFERNLADADNWLPMQMPSVEAASVCAGRGNRFDMVFIDASHDYENVKRDIAAWRPLLTKGGLMCGHDASWPGVKQAVEEAFGACVVVPGTDIWIGTGENNG